MRATAPAVAFYFVVFNNCDRNNIINTGVFCAQCRRVVHRSVHIHSVLIHWRFSMCPCNRNNNAKWHRPDFANSEMLSLPALCGPGACTARSPFARTKLYNHYVNRFFQTTPTPPFKLASAHCLGTISLSRILMQR